MKRLASVCWVEFAVVLILPLAVPQVVSQVEGAAQMPPIDISTEFGPVISQIPEYRYEIIPKDRRTQGQEKALASGRGWLESVLTNEFRPKSNLLEFIHNRQTDTCDAVQFQYPVEAEFGEVTLHISQTVFVTVIFVIPRVPPASWRGSPDRAAIEFARRLFQHPERLNFRTDKHGAGFSLGRQIIPASTPPEAVDWLDTLVWWSDGTTLGFGFLKRTGSGQSARTSLDLQPNQIWFQLFERQRTR